MGNEFSESMREMCGRVSSSVRANAPVYAPQSSWNAQELKETACQSLFFAFSHISVILSLHVSLILVALHSYQLAALSLIFIFFFFKPPGGKSFGQKQDTDVSLHVLVDRLG